MPADSYHHGALHDAILTAAVDEARRSGPSGIQVRALAKTVGVSASAVYRHVPSLDVLVAEVAQVAREQLAAHLIEARDGAAPRRTRQARAHERFRAIGRGYVTFALEQPHLFDTAFAPTTSPPLRPDSPSAWQVLIDGVHELIDSGALTTTDVERAALIAWSGVHGIASILVRQALVSPMPADSVIDTVLDATMRALATL
jgi:AcrR family transcriptional regulator